MQQKTQVQFFFSTDIIRKKEGLIIKTILSQCSISIPSENIRKSLVEGVKMENWIEMG